MNVQKDATLLHLKMESEGYEPWNKGGFYKYKTKGNVSPPQFPEWSEVLFYSLILA